MRILVAAMPFGETNQEARHLLESEGVEIVQFKDKGLLTESMLDYLLEDIDGVIAGLEQYSSDLIQRNSGHLRILTRLGSGYDNIDIAATSKY